MIDDKCFSIEINVELIKQVKLAMIVRTQYVFLFFILFIFGKIFKIRIERAF